MELKVELHTHTSDDPVDVVPHSTPDLIDRAAALGYHALAITLHNHQMDLAPFRSHAAARGIVLIPGVERTIEGSHILLINFSARAAAVETYAALAELRAREPNGLVIAPHPYFPMGEALGRDLNRHAELFDAVEVNAVYATRLNFNRPAIRWAARHVKPLVGNGDVHRLVQLGSTYSLVDAEPDPQAICDAIKAGRVRVGTRPMTLWRAVSVYVDILATWVWNLGRKRPRPITPVALNTPPD